MLFCLKNCKLVKYYLKKDEKTNTVKIAPKLENGAKEAILFVDGKEVMVPVEGKKRKQKQIQTFTFAYADVKYTKYELKV